MLLERRAIGFVGELHPQWRQAWELAAAPVMFELELGAVLQHPVPQFSPVPRQQAVERDLAVVVAEQVTHAQIMAAIASALPATLLRSAVLFDVYRSKPLKAGEVQPATALAAGDKSLAVRLTLGAGDATLAEADIEAAVQAVLDQLAAQTGAKLRA